MTTRRNGLCREANAGQSVFVESTITDPTTPRMVDLRDFSVVEQDQSGNLNTSYSALVNGARAARDQVFRELDTTDVPCRPNVRGVEFTGLTHNS